MYANNTDLIHWAGQPSCSPRKLIAAAQIATYAWGSRTIATGAALKPEKCYAYFLSYWYNPGRAKLRTVRSLPASIALIILLSGKIAPSHLRVPLQDGTSAPISTLCNKDVSLMLGYTLVLHLAVVHTFARWQKRLHMGRPDQITSTPTHLHGRVFPTNYNQE